MADDGGHLVAVVESNPKVTVSGETFFLVHMARSIGSAIRFAQADIHCLYSAIPSKVSCSVSSSISP
jgi:hypothetical protein